MRSCIALLLMAALAVPLVGCEAGARIDADDDHPGRGVGHARHDRDTDVDVRARTDVPDADVKAEGKIDVDD